ncbi:helix-turn-helix domain-containing protein [Flavihumibacter solisilvae]|uniref:AAA+ ATPase domain-containing protein n=1 Tax=Flavihumibacter solisilvae TaxID=1349421 RepID=A0A0C1LA26_9BACT|nr:helix-turn-helix domain-containing protein [Flavihumibacter solisilvae]KIC96371.1 hypothetical protein OI18_01035 [Flavihumibacter solisilvae]
MGTDSGNYHFDLAARYVRHTGRNIFLTGKAGTGKTTFLKYIRDNCSKKIAVVAPTGVAAINAGGVTIHTFFQLPLGSYVPTGSIPDSGEQLFNNRQTLLRNLRLSSAKRELMRELELIIVDEVSMLRSDMLDAMDAVLRHVRKHPYQPFGGVQVLFIGDLFQLPPVVQAKEWTFLKEVYASPFFFDAHVMKENLPVFLELKKIYRQSEQLFIDLLNRVRNNILEASDLHLLNSRYRHDFEPGPDQQFITLTTHNARADHLNQLALHKLTAPVFRFSAVITGDFSENAYPADPELELKLGAQVMFIKNDKGEDRRYFNGLLARVNEIDQNTIKVSIAGRDELLEIERETWRNIRYRYDKSRDRVEEEELGTFSQFPIRLAWAITIHKSQGLTFDRAVVDAGSAFAPGQVYVALSRLTNLDGLSLGSRITQASVQTDHRVLEFISGEKGSEELERELLLSEGEFIRNTMLSAFQLNSLKEQAEMWVLDTEKRNPVSIKALEWALRFREEVRQLVPVAEKTIAHLLKYYESGDQVLSVLAERTAAAANYFSMALRRIMDGLDVHMEEMKGEKRTGKYIKELQSLRSMFLIRLDYIGKSQSLSQALAAGDSLDSLLKMVDKRVEIEEKIEEETEKRSKKGTGEKRVKGETTRLSLTLFISGKTIDEIAFERHLAASTIAGHLVGFVESGELDLETLVSSEKSTVIRNVIRSSDNNQLSVIKQKLGEQYSYVDIKAVIARIRFENQKEQV